MPAPSIDGHAYEARVHWRLHNQDMFNVMHFVSAGSSDLLNDLLIPLLTCFTDHLIPVLSNECELIDADVKDLTDPTQNQYSTTPADLGVGTEAVNSLPGFNTAVIKLRTSHGGKSGRGRLSLSGIPEDRAALGSIDATFLAAAAAFIACVVAKFIAGDPPAAVRFDWAVRSRKLNQYFPVTQAVAKSLIGTMRSRKIR